MDKANLFGQPRQHLLSLVRALFDADADEGISTDELMCVSGLTAEKVRAALYDLEKFGIASNDTALTAFVHAGVKNSSKKRLEETAALEIALIAQMREAAPDLQKGEGSLLQLRHATQRLKDAGRSHALPKKLARIIRSLASDGRNEDSGLGSIRFKNIDAESIYVTLQRNWQALEDTAALRRTAANVIVEHLLSVPRDQEQGVDLLAQTSLGQLLAAVEADITLKAIAKDPAKLLDRALLWLHEQEVIRLNKGLAVFRPAMTIHLGQSRQNFLKADFTPLKLHYDEQVVQIHVMSEYVQRGLQAMAEALGLTMDYFSLNRDDFMRRWLPEREKELARQTTPASWRSIVEDLNNPIQQRIVTDEREQTNVLVLAGPGSGKTRVLVHRIAYLLRVKRENPHGILALAYNRHAAVEIRRRLDAWIGDDACGVIVLTCHALAMRLAGVSFSARASRDKKEFEQLLKQVIPQAVALLNGTGLLPEETDAADAQRDRLLAAFRWILVDEYQDIGPDQYALISALAGRTRSEEDGRLSLFAVGDDDQNIYAFNGSSVEFIRRFETDYAAKPAFLIENYRSTHHIIDAANLLIAPTVKRMKAVNPVIVNRARNKAAAGGAWQALDPVGKGRVQILSLPAGGNALSQAVAVMTELMRLARLVPDWDWSQAAVISRNWDVLEPVRSFCALNGIPVQMANEDVSQFWRLRETQALVEWLRNQEHRLTDAVAIKTWLAMQPNGPWWSLLQDAVSEYALETSATELPTEHFVEWLVDWGREARRKQTGLLLLTAHRAKGLEFAHVAVLDGDWQRLGPDEDADAPRRLPYVAMTRAKSTLMLARMQVAGNASPHLINALIDALPDAPCLLRRAPDYVTTIAPELLRRYVRLTMKDIDIGFAGRFAEDHPVHRAIAGLSARDALALSQTEARWELVNDAGVTVGRLSKAFTPPARMNFLSAQVAAIVCRKREDGDPAQQNYNRCAHWEIVMAELVFAP